MCGRTVCSLAPDKLCKACQFLDQNGSIQKPHWKAASDGHEYFPSYNFCPQNYGPVLLSASHFKEGSEYKPEDRVIQPMKWGLIPSWSKDESSYKMINARSDGLLSKSSFKTPLSKGRRCVVVADGFYEWEKEKNGNKQAYFIHMPQEKDVDWEKADETESTEDAGGWSGRRLMFMAGLFDVNNQMSDQPLYSYTIITVDAAKSTSFLHERMPAILTSEESLLSWLDFENVPMEEALKVLTPLEDLKWFKVSKNVNNASYKGTDCVRLSDEQKVEKKNGNQKNLLNYFTKVPKKSPAKEEEKNCETESPKKKIKKDSEGDD